MASRLFSQSSQRFLTTGALVALLSHASLVHAQTFDSGSTGSDGALNLTTPGTVEFDPKSFNPPLDQDGDNIYHFTTINIGPGVIVLLTARKINGPVFWLAKNKVQIDGTIDLSGEDGPPDSVIPAERRPAEPGPGGYRGGIGGVGGSSPQPGIGPGGGHARADRCDAVGGGGGYAEQGFPGPPAGDTTHGQPYGNVFLVPLLGGSGGGGVIGGFNGGAGGGALLISSSTAITITGTIKANGGNTVAKPCGAGSGGAGPGSGGGIRLVSTTIDGTGSVIAIGGTSNSFARGSVGRIRFEAFQYNFTGTTNPTRVLASPFALFLPTNQSTVRVVSVDGVPVPPNPTGSFTVPDVAMNKSTAVTANIEAHNIPRGTVVKLHLFSENGADQIIDSAPLAGTNDATSTTTASVVIPPGFSRGFVRATWQNQ